MKKMYKLNFFLAVTRAVTQSYPRKKLSKIFRKSKKISWKSVGNIPEVD